MASAERLTGCRILVVEDDWFISNDLKRMLARHGANLIGPVATLDEALDLARQDGFELAIIDIKLRDGMAYPVADELRRQSVPFVFATGYPSDAIPDRFSDVLLFEKPFEAVGLLGETERLCRAQQQ